MSDGVREWLLEGRDELLGANPGLMLVIALLLGLVGIKRFRSSERKLGTTLIAIGSVVAMTSLVRLVWWS